MQTIGITLLDRRFVRLLGGVALVLVGVIGIGSAVVLAFLLVGVLGHPQVTHRVGGPAGPFPPPAFQPAHASADRTGWRVAAVLVRAHETLVVSAVRSGAQPANVTLSDGSGHTYPPRVGPLDMSLPASVTDAAGHRWLYQVVAFAPLQGGTTLVVIHHAVPRGGIARVPVRLP